MIIYYMMQTIELWIFVGILGVALIVEEVYNRLTAQG